MSTLFEIGSSMSTKGRPVLTFSNNPSYEIKSEAAEVLLNKKLVTQSDIIGASEFFVKICGGKIGCSKVKNVGGFGYQIERNTTMVIGKREMPLLISEELNLGQKGIAESILATESFANDEYWIEECDLDIKLVEEVFNYIEDYISERETKTGRRSFPNLRTMIRKALEGNPRVISNLTTLVKKYNNLNDIFIKLDVITITTTIQKAYCLLQEYNTLESFIKYLLKHKKFGVAMGLYN
ncbi:hypothetical protein [Paenibacillus sp. FSL R7-0337]|uniref:hypothetical protein n=1 Tax=Paenibacillus sp. FSL R7-0337 TaxID=1926588 RepID=UPI00096CBAEC|nr:hypothetical protein [Paenibacillus sp. FSL R7-0337]OMF88754.1 hypothetical protein BK147_26480 [Paenibacillus sp. FSL R7-0337]